MATPENDFYDDFKYPIAPSLKPFGLFKRRVHQGLQILFSRRYKSPMSLKESVSSHYSLSQEVDFYSRYSSYGLHENELEAYFWIKSQAREQSKALVVGCGVGREALFFEKQETFTQIDAFDNNPNMIEAAKSLHKESNVGFRLSLLDSPSLYDLIWVTAILESHIQGRENRVAFFKEIKSFAKTDSYFVFTPQFKKMTWRHPYFWSSQLLRLRWKGKAWEPGDVLLANLGAHHITEKLVYSHFYQSKEHFINELIEAGFNNFKELSGGSWVIQS